MNDECRNFAPLWADYRWMNSAERAPLDRHLAGCPHCREELRQAQVVGDLFLQARTPAPRGFADNIMAAIATEPQPARWALPVVLGALAIEAVLALALRVGPVTWWQTATSAGGQLIRQWGAPLFGGWSDLLTTLIGTVPGIGQMNAALWGGAVLVVVLFSWITINRGRTENV